MRLKKVEKRLRQSFSAIPSEAVGALEKRRKINATVQVEAQENQAQLLDLVSHS